MQHNHQHVLENHSLCKSLAMIEKPDCNFIEGWSWDDKRAFRATVITMVLATDMSQHFDIVGSFTSKFTMDTVSQARNGKGESLKFWTLDQQGQRLCLQIALKVADIGHSFATWEVHCMWSSCLQNEMFAQGDMEAALGMDISPLMDRTKRGCMHPENQLGFFDVIVVPLLKAFSTAFHGANKCLELTATNRRNWKEMLSAEIHSIP
mmetsp:Transcript_41533/g.98429  ORF Transcript_41533/g.98429 Transcript_41533/m.98429 type:complete len:207 (+) Transcript_41533:643-1263(+)